MRLDINGLEEDSGNPFPTIPAGIYEARVTEVSVEETSPRSKYPGHPMLKMKYTVAPGSEHEGHSVMDWQVLPHEEMDSEQFRINRSKVKALCLAAGVDIEEDGFDTDDMLDAEVKILVDVETNDGQKRNTVKKVMEAD